MSDYEKDKNLCVAEIRLPPLVEHCPRLELYITSNGDIRLRSTCEDKASEIVIEDQDVERIRDALTHLLHQFDQWTNWAEGLAEIKERDDVIARQYVLRRAADRGS